MSEKIYSWLLRLYPSHFRRAYGNDALQLFRDRSRDESSFLPRVRLWLDLLADLALSVPREYFYVRPELMSYSAHLRSEGQPSFFVLAEESPGPGALLFGSVLSLAALITFSLLLNHGVHYLPLSALIRPAHGAADHHTRASSPQDWQSANGNVAGAGGSSSGQKSLGEESQQPPNGDNPAGWEEKLGAAERHRVIDGAIANLKQHYVDADLARKMGDALQAQEKNGADNAATDGRTFARLLTRQMRDVSHDMHLDLLYSKVPLPERSPTSTPEFDASYRRAMEQSNCTFEPVKILPHNVGYLKLNSFPDPSVCQATARAAMASLNHADAVIFDLRDNHGGYPEMVMLIAAYLFNHPEYMYNPRDNTTEQSWTRSPVPGSRLADKSVYVLTSVRTFSGAEHFSYDLKMLKRATLVGERTGGATDVGTFHRIDDHFGMGIRETRAINPYSEPDWAGIGVEPDVKVKAEDALATAVRLAESKLEKK